MIELTATLFLRSVSLLLIILLVKQADIPSFVLFTTVIGAACFWFGADYTTQIFYFSESKEDDK